MTLLGPPAGTQRAGSGGRVPLGSTRRGGPCALRSGAGAPTSPAGAVSTYSSRGVEATGYSSSRGSGSRGSGGGHEGAPHENNDRGHIRWADEDSGILSSPPSSDAPGG